MMTEIDLFIIVGLVLNAVFSIWVFFDARTRKNRSFGWSLLTFILGPFIALPLYFAYRNLKKEEVRAGGTVWHIIRNYTLSWTVFMVWMVFVSLGSTSVTSGIFFFIFWLFSTLIMMALGLFVKQSSIIERGSPELE